MVAGAASTTSTCDTTGHRLPTLGTLRTTPPTCRCVRAPVACGRRAGDRGRGPAVRRGGAVRASWFVSPRRSRAKIPSVRHVSGDEIQDEVHQLDALESSDL